MATFTKINGFVEHLAEKVHNLGADALTFALSTAVPTLTTTAQAVKASVTEIAYTNLSTRVITISASSQTSGTYSLVATDLVLTASGGSVAAFRYLFIYNDTATNDELIGYYDYGSSLTLLDTETLTVDFGSSLLTVA